MQWDLGGEVKMETLPWLYKILSPFTASHTTLHCTDPMQINSTLQPHTLGLIIQLQYIRSVSSYMIPHI